MSTLGPYARVGAKLVERGYSAIPIMPGSKRPGQMRGGEWFGMSNWHEIYSKRLPSGFEIQDWSASQAGVGVLAGPGSQHLIGIDIDTDDPEINEAIRSILPSATPVRKKGEKGETLIYRCPGFVVVSGKSSFPIKSQRVCDIIGPGRQMLLPPTIHPKTREPYYWTGTEALEDVDPEDLPMLPVDIADLIAEVLKPLGYEPEPEHKPLVNGHATNEDATPRPHRLLNDAALDNLSAWVPQLKLIRCRKTAQGYEALPHWRPSSTGRDEKQRALNLKIHPTGIVDFGADRTYTPITLVMETNGCDLDTAFRTLAEAVGWSADQVIIQTALVAKEQNDVPVNLELDQTKKPDPILRFTEPKGLIGELVNWITDTARRPNRVLALGAAITIIGTLVGRRAQGPTKTGTHLYVLALAPTGAGKQHAIDCIMQLMSVAKAEHHIGPSEFISMPAVINFLMRQPLSLCPQDEFGAFLKRINSRGAKGFEASISKVLRTLWGLNFGKTLTPEWAGRKAEMIKCPALSIYGVSVPEDFFDALQNSDISNGFLNRFLVLNTDEYSPDMTPRLEPGVVPNKLITALGELYNWSGSPLATARLNDVGLDPKPDEIHWADNQAESIFADFSLFIEAEMKRETSIKLFIARSAEMAVRLATILAVGRCGREALVDVSDMEWGRDLVWECGQSLARASAKYMAENERQAWNNRIVRLIQRRRVIKPREVQQYVRGALRSADIKDILAGLVEAGEIEPIISISGNRQTIAGYRYTGDPP